MSFFFRKKKELSLSSPSSSLSVAFARIALSLFSLSHQFNSSYTYLSLPSSNPLHLAHPDVVALVSHGEHAVRRGEAGQRRVPCARGD